MSGAALFKKDVRLAADAMGPWSLFVAAFVVCAIVLAITPRAWRPEMFRALGTPELFELVLHAVRLTAPLIASWITIAVLHGDERHGGAALCALVPASRAHRFSAKMGAIALGILPPTAVILGLGLTSGQPLASGQAILDVLEVVGVQLAAVAHVVLLSRFIHRAWVVVLSSCCVLLLWMLIGAVTARLTVDVLSAELRSIAVNGGEAWRLSGLDARVKWSGAVNALAAASIVIGATALAARLRRGHGSGRLVLCLGLSVAAIVGTGMAGVTAWRAIPSPSDRESWPSVMAARVRSMTDEELSTAFASMWHRRRSGISYRSAWSAISEEVRGRNWGREQRGDDLSGLQTTVERMMDFSTEFSTQESLWDLAPLLRSPSDGASLRPYLDATARYPTDGNVLSATFNAGVNQGSWPLEEFRSFNSAKEFTEGVRTALIRVLKDQVERGHPEAARMRVALTALEEAAATSSAPEGTLPRAVP
ncbi:MAG: hypothetical protein JNM94_05290 [Phycisphaerae bacterium]|nr:hypothetical protein [Phycisphaerae bacterium]